MARPTKSGLEYFPLDVDIDQDDKLFFIEAKYGLLGFAVVVRILMLIYKEGYYRQYSEEKEAYKLAKRLSVDVDVIKNVVNDCINEGFFDRNLYEKYSILTSRGIQKRYMEACGRRKEVVIIHPYFLLNYKKYKNIVFEYIHEVNADVISKKCNIMPTENPQSKVKESKEEESKKDTSSPPAPPYDEIVSLHHKHAPSLPKVSKLSDKRRKVIRARWRASPDISVFETLFIKAEDSDFLSGRNGQWTSCSFDWLLKESNMLKVLEGNYDNKKPPPKGGGPGDRDFSHLYNVPEV